jgi:hypothetical protein
LLSKINLRGYILLINYPPITLTRSHGFLDDKFKMHASILSIVLAAGVCGVNASPARMSRRSGLLEPRACHTTGHVLPNEADWADYETIWGSQRKKLEGQGLTSTELDTVHSAMISNSADANMNPAFALAISIKESGANPRIRCGDEGQSCGMMQVKGSSDACAEITTPCPSQNIEAQISCGINGLNCGTNSVTTTKGVCLKDVKAENGDDYSKTARAYNSGSVINPNDLSYVIVDGVEIGDPQYVFNLGEHLVNC